MGIFQLMSEPHYLKLWDNFGSRKPVKDFLLQAFLLFRDLVTRSTYPSDWSVMRYLVNHVMLQTLQEFAKPLILYFQDEPHFDNQLWTNYFTLSVAFLTQSSLQLECLQSQVCGQFESRRARKERSITPTLFSTQVT